MRNHDHKQVHLVLEWQDRNLNVHFVDCFMNEAKKSVQAGERNVTTVVQGTISNHVAGMCKQLSKMTNLKRLQNKNSGLTTLTVQSMQKQKPILL